MCCAPVRSEPVDIFDDLGAEQDRLETILASLDATAWATESGAPGWSITDVVLHLAQTEEGVVASAATGDEIPPGGGWRNDGETVDAAVERRVRAEQAAAPEVFERWRGARRAALAALRSADPNRRLTWAETPLKPATLATTRLAEHWAHGLDITEPLGVDFPDTARLRHVAWLGHATLPYAFALAGERFDEVFCESACTGRLDVAIRRSRRSVLDSWPGGRVLPRRCPSAATRGFHLGRRRPDRPDGAQAAAQLRDVTRGTQLAQPHAPPQQPPPPTGAGSRAWVVPGVANVDNNLTVSSCPSGHGASLAASAIDRRTSNRR